MYNYRIRHSTLTAEIHGLQTCSFTLKTNHQREVEMCCIPFADLIYALKQSLKTKYAAADKTKPPDSQDLRVGKGVCTVFVPRQPSLKKKVLVVEIKKTEFLPHRIHSF